MYNVCINIWLLQLQQKETVHRSELGRITSELEDETETRSDMDNTLADLRKEVRTEIIVLHVHCIRIFLLTDYK